jgi:hypothetical protein
MARKLVYRFIAPVVYIMFLCYGFGILNGEQRDVDTNRPIIGIMTQSTRLLAKVTHLHPM